MAQPIPMHKNLLPALISALCFSSNSLADDGEWSCQADENGKWQCEAIAERQGKYASPLPLTATAGAQANAALVSTGANLDWYPRSQMSSEQLKQVQPQCEGMYIEPPNASPTAGQPLDEAEISARAGGTELRQNNIAVFDGGVEIFKGDLQVTAEQATLNKEEDTLSLEGDVMIRDSGLLILGESADIQLGDQTGQIHAATYVMHEEHSRGEAEMIDRRGEDITFIDKGSYTHCAPDSNAWSLKASEITLNQETGLGKAKHARIKIKDIPILYTPYLSFPMDDRRRTGFLWPNFSTTENPDGYDITAPFYINIAPNWDATVAARSLTDRGLMGEGELRHLNRFSDWIVSGAYLDDDVYEDTRWLAAVKEQGRFTQDWWHQINYTEVSDEDYLNDLSSQSLAVKRETHLTQTGAFGYTGENWMFSTEVTDYQTLRFLDLTDNLVKPYKLLPQVQLQTRHFDVPFEAQWQLFTQATYFDTNENRPKGSRVYVAPGFSYPMEWMAGFIKPTVKVRSVSYSLDDDNPLPGIDEDSPSTTAPMASLDMGLFFERDDSWFGTNFTQTLEPRLYYLYSDREEQDDQPLFDTFNLTFDYSQLFRESRFTGYDRIDDSNQLTLGLTTRFIDDNTGRETFSASLGQILYFDDREVNLVNNQVITDTSSEIAGELRWRPWDELTADATLTWDTDNNKVQRGVAQMRYHTDNHLIFNLGYRYESRPDITSADGQQLDNDINETEFSTVLPISRNWALFGQLQYDHTNERDIEQTAGLEYDSCCWRVRLLYQEGLDGNNVSESAVYLQFELKGLGSSGSKISNILDESIIGFRERENDER